MAEANKPKLEKDLAKPNPVANEDRDSVSGAKVRDLAVPPFVGFDVHVEKQIAKVEKFGPDLSVTETEQLMRNVQAAQSNLTSGLAQLSAYRKAVARLLETKRKAAAQARKAAVKTKPLGLVLDNLDFPPATDDSQLIE